MPEIVPPRDTSAIPMALTFDDVLLRPAASSVLPADANTKTRVTREVELGIPLVLSLIHI